MTTDADRLKFFARTMVYARQDQDVVLVDMHDATATQPLDPWLGKVLLLADGTHTVRELVAYISAHYRGNPPPNLEDTLHSVVDRLLESGAIALADAPVTLPYYLALAADKQDPKKAHRLMLEDGFEQGQLPGIS